MTTLPNAIFLDRDGVINREKGDYITRPEDFELLPHALNHIKALHKKGVKIFVITNQGGIAKGLYTLETLQQIHSNMLTSIRENGGDITEIFFCPHHSVKGNCLCRKPGSILVEKALAKYALDPAQTLFIGDKPRDMQAAAAAGVRGVLIEENTDWGFVLEL